MTVSIPTQKVDKYCQSIKNIVSNKYCSQGELKTIIGQLNWVCSILKPGRAFLRRLHDAVKGPHNPNLLIQISMEMRKDLLIWFQFLINFNGKMLISYMPTENSAMLNFYSDASKFGAGAIFGTQWIQIKYPSHWIKKGITFLELYPIVVMAHVVSSKIKGKKVVFHTDNIAVMAILNKCSSKHSEIMKLVRALMLLSLQNNFIITSAYLPGIQNVLPDKISRFQASTEDLMRMNLNKTPTQIPQPWNPVTWESNQ